MSGYPDPPVPGPSSQPPPGYPPPGYAPPPGYQYGGPLPGGVPGGPAGGPPREALGGFWTRFLASFIDGLILGVVVFAFTLLGVTLLDSPGGGFVSYVLGPAYFTYFHSTPAGQTVGDRATGLRVVDAATGGPLTPGRAFVRWAVSLVSGFAFAIGYLWMLWDPQRQTWHDKAAGSLVVQSRYYPPPA